MGGNVGRREGGWEGGGNVGRRGEGEGAWVRALFLYF